MGDKVEQRANAEESSNIVQAARDINIINSSNYSEVRQIFIDLYDANNYKVQNILMKKIEEKIDLLTYKFLNEVEKINKVKNIEYLELKNNISNVSTQMLANLCLQQSVYKDKEDVTEILAKLLAEKVTSDNHDYLIEDAIDSLKYLSSNDINFIKFFYSVIYGSYSIYILGKHYEIFKYFDQINEADLKDDEKEYLLNQIYAEAVKLYNNLGKCFSISELKTVDYNYLMSKGWFYVNYLQVPDPIEHLSKFFKKPNGALHTKQEIKELFPELVKVWEIFTQGNYQSNPLSTIGQLIGRKTTESLISEIIQISFNQK